MPRIRIPFRLIFAIIIAALGLTLLFWGLAAPQRIIRRQVIEPKQMQLPGGQAAVPETRLLTLEYPAIIRADESDRLRMTVEVQQGAQAAGIPNVYETHQVIAESHFDMASMNVRPSGTVSEPLLAGQRATFFWSVRPGEVGKFQGTVWLYLRYIPKDGGPEIRQTISAQTIEIESSAFFGLQADSARLLGSLGIFIGVALGFSFFINGIKWLIKRKSSGSEDSAQTPTG